MMNIDSPSSPGGNGGQPPKKIEAYQCNLCPAVFGFKFNAKRHFQKLHPDDNYDGSKIANIKFKCYGCQWGFDTYGNLESHFAQVHQGQILNPEKVYLGDTQTTAATFQSVKRMKTPSKRKRPAASQAESHTSRPSSANSIGSTAAAVPQAPPASQHSSQFYGLQHRHNDVMMAPGGGHPGGDRTPSSMSYQGDLLCNSCDFTSDNPQSLALHQQTHIQPHFNSNEMPSHHQQPPTQQAPPPPSQQHYYNAAHQPQPPHHDPFIDFKAEEQQYQQHMYQQTYQPPYHHGYQPQQQGYHHYPPSHHQMYNNQMPQQYQNGYENYHHYPPPPHHTPPPPPPPPVPNQPPSHTPPHPSPQMPYPPSHQAPPPPQHYHEVPQYQPQSQQQSMISNSSTFSDPQPQQQHLTEVKSEPNEALINRNQPNGNVATGGGGGSDLSTTPQHSPYHVHPHQQPGTQGLQPDYSPASARQSNGADSSKSAAVASTVAATAKQRRTNIGKRFQTHICFVCDSKLAKLDCIKMHFKNKHPETQLDLNQVLISRVVCYICGVRKKEYAILVRHFQVEHKDQEIDPYRIGMDEPSPFNLSPEEEADLMKLPIPEPVKHDLKNFADRKISGAVKSFSDRSSSHLDSNNDNTMDSIEDEQYQLPPESELVASTNDNNDHHMSSFHSPSVEATSPSWSYSTAQQQQPPKKKPRMKRAFKNNKCRTCGKAFSRITTVKKHFLEHHPTEVFDRSTKVEVIKLPCYLCDTMITDARHALRHFESAHPGQEFDANLVQISGVEFTNGANEEDDADDSMDNDQPRMIKPEDNDAEGTRAHGFRCYLCNYWCSKIEDFQAHFAPETKAHENVSEVTIICPVCMHKCETTDEMFDHVTKEHGAATGNSDACGTEDDASISSSSLSLKEEVPPPPAPAAAATQTVNNATNCVETC